MTCPHVGAQAVVSVRASTVRLAKSHEVTPALEFGAAWCPDCGAFRDSDGVWHRPESARTRVTVAPPSPHRIQSTGERPVFPEMLPPEV